MPTEHDPLSREPAVPSPEKRAFHARPRNGGGLRQPNIAVFHHAMSTTPRPSSPDDSVAFGYMELAKFHDREPEAIVTAIEAIDPAWFDDYPRKPGTKLDDRFKRAVVGELARTFYKYGLSAYGKPGLRKNGEEDTDGTLGII